MPRSENVYSLPNGTDAIPGEVISSAKYNAALRDIEEDLNAVRPVSAGGTGVTTLSQLKSSLGVIDPTSAAYASLSALATATPPATARAVTVDGQTYVLDATHGPATSADGRRWLHLDFHGRFERLVADMLHGASVNLVAYGDSTTDGNGTTGWTPNPVNGSIQPLGTAAHEPEFAWPTRAGQTLRGMFGNNSIQVRNAGYSGRQLQDGWAYNNFTAAMAPYGTPTAVFIGFGINDVRQAGFSPADFEEELIKLCKRIARIGAFPIFVTPDEPSAQQHNGWLLGKVGEVYRSVGARLGVKVIDWGKAQNEMAQCSDGTLFRLAADQPDDTHGNDSWHSVKAGYISACMYPHTVWLDKPITDVAAWSRYCNPKPGYTVVQLTTNKFGAAMVTPANSYVTEENLLDCFVWSSGAARKAFWMAVDANAYWSPRTMGNAPVIAMRDWALMETKTVIAPASGAGQLADGYRDGEAPGLLFRVPQGLSRWNFRAPKDNNSRDVYLGYFSFREVRPLFAMSAPLFVAPASGQIIDREPEGDIPQVFGFQPGGRVTNLALEVNLQEGMGVSLWSSRVYGANVPRESNRKRGLFLFRHGTDDRLFLYNALFEADGAIVDVSTLGSTDIITWGGWRPLRLVAGVDSVSQYIRIYGGWSGNTAVISHNNPLTSAPIPWGGTPGAVWQHTGATGVAGVKIYGDI